MKRLGIALLCLGVVGCATSRTYVKQGSTGEEQQRALAQCKVQAMMVPDAGAFTAAIVDETIDNCMRAQGFVRTN